MKPRVPNSQSNSHIVWLDARNSGLSDQFVGLSLLHFEVRCFTLQGRALDGPSALCGNAAQRIGILVHPRGGRVGSIRTCSSFTCPTTKASSSTAIKKALVADTRSPWRTSYAWATSGCLTPTIHPVEFGRNQIKGFSSESMDSYWKAVVAPQTSHTCNWDASSTTGNSGWR
jgi:hypothetical protein